MNREELIEKIATIIYNATKFDSATARAYAEDILDLVLDNQTHILMVGNLSEGYGAYGPFSSFDEAAEAEIELDKSMKGSWVMTLHSPEGGDAKPDD